MRISFPILLILLLAACQKKPEILTNVKVDMANPASVYCHHKNGKLSVIKSSDETISYCTLPSGELIEEWALYHRDHPKI